MKKFIHKVQDISRRAAELKQAVQTMPGKAAELREAAVMTAGELQQLRAEVQTNLTSLRANSEDRIIEAMREITAHAGTFEQAGYELAGMDLDFSLTQRLAVQFEKFEEVPHSTLQSLLARETRPTIKSILAGMMKAEETAANVELEGLSYEALTVHIGAAPAIRMCWRSPIDTAEPAMISAGTAMSPVGAPPPLPASTAPGVSPAFGSLFEQRSFTPAVSQSPALVASAAAPDVTVPTQESTAAEQGSTIASYLSSGSDASSDRKTAWSRESLERFKKMPGASKYK